MSDHRKAQQGMTLLEMIISLSLLGFVFAAIFGMYMTGLTMWSGNDSRSQLIQGVQVSNRSLRSMVAESTAPGVSVSADGKILALISPRDLNGNTDLSPQGLRRWQSWEVYYQDGNYLRRTQVAWTGATAAEREVPDTLENITGLTLDAVATNGRMVAEHLYDVAFVGNLGQGLVEADLEFRRWSKARPDGERIKVHSTFRLRN